MQLNLVLKHLKKIKLKKCLNVRQKQGTKNVLENLQNCKTCKTHSFNLSFTLDMLNNFCFHVYAQKSLFKVENDNGFFLDSRTLLITLSCEFANHRAGSQLKSIVIFTHKHFLYHNTTPEDQPKNSFKRKTISL